jgi:hypothetical protein
VVGLRNDCRVLRSEIVLLAAGERSAVVVVRLALGVRVVLLLLPARRDELGAARVMVGTPLEVVRVGALERDRLEVLGVPLERELELVRGAVDELREVPEPDERVMPRDELPADPLEDRLVLPDEPLEDRLVLPEERLTPPDDDRLVPPDERLMPPDDRLLLPDEAPEDRLLEPEERLTPPDERPEDGSEPPEDRLTPPDERLPEDPLTPPDDRLEPPEDPPPLPPRDARCASTRFTGAANIATVNTAKRKKKTRLGVGISDLRPSSDAGNEKSPAGKLLRQ